MVEEVVAAKGLAQVYQQSNSVKCYMIYDMTATQL